VRQTLEADARFDETLPEALLRSDHTYGGVDPVIASRQKPEALASLVQQFRLGQDSPADGDHRVGSDNIGTPQFLVEPDGLQSRLSLGAGNPGCTGRGQFARLRDLVDVSGLQGIRLDAGLVDQGEPARRAGSKDEFGSADHRSGTASGRIFDPEGGRKTY